MQKYTDAQSMNMLPADPEWLKKVESLAQQAAEELKCMTVLVAVQEEGKLAVELKGVPQTGPLAEVAKDTPRLLAMLSYVCKMQDDLLRKNTQ